MTMTPKDKDSLVERLTNIERTLDEISRKTFSTFTVTDSSGAQMLSVLIGNQNRRQVTLRDSAADALLQNDVNGAGWGFAHPQPANTSVAVRNYTGNNNTTTSDTTVWSVFMPVLTQKIHGYGLMCIEDSGNVSRNGTFTVRWAPLGTTSYTVIDTATASGAHIASSREFDYTWPSNMYGQIVEVSFWSFTSTVSAGTTSSYIPVGIAERPF